jgi:hypothetical protein
VLLFGTRFSNPEHLQGDNPYASNPSWCLLVKDNGAFNLECHFNTPTETQGAQNRCSSLGLGGGVMLHASAVRTNISMDIFELIKLWVTTEDTNNEADGVESIKGSLPFRHTKSKI